ncbi:unnamed protein product [Brachionus calyciflorus]|uniref:SAYSvFN domain-containing protein n=1 Tax=Brachionus calyciflorus TaxID=104777 RepID=A0A814ELW9_9BILA|nr:unnamed protein product [Brachionus calyciflorus]
MDIEEKLAKYRQNKSNEQVSKRDEERSFFTTNFFTKYFKEKDKTEKIEKFKPPLVKRKIQLVEKKSNPILINELPDEYQEEPEEIKTWISKLALKFLLWVLLYALFIKLEFGVVYLICSLLVLVYLNTNVGKKSKISAYSVFNPNVERIQGTLTSEQLEKNLISPF